jgi:NitT/TauT family transport system substrate-binding protein
MFSQRKENGKLVLITTGCFLVFFVGMLAGCTRGTTASDSSSGMGLTKVTLQADWYPQPEHGGFYTALAKGYYKDEGLDVTIQPGGPYTVVEQQVSVGAAQFGMGSSDRTLESVADGQPLVAVAATMQRDPQGIMVRKDSPSTLSPTSMAISSRSSPATPGSPTWSSAIT